jgi:DNA invertase Pin-like site-specific DNA recombinase
MANIAYLRVSTTRQDLTNQKLAILEHANKAGLTVDAFIEVEASSRRAQRTRRIDHILKLVGPGDTLIVSELSRLGRSTVEVLLICEQLARQQTRLVAVKQGLDFAKQDLTTKVMLTILGLAAELERDFISERTKMGLDRARASGKKIGRPKGSLGESKLDKHKDEILRLLAAKAPYSVIGRLTGCSPATVSRYVNRRGLAAKTRKGENDSLNPCQHPPVTREENF